MKKLPISIFQLFALISSLIVLSSCDETSEYGYNGDFDQHNFPPFYVSADHQSATLDGILDSNSFSQFNQMLNEHPEIKTIFFDQAPGSVDDDVTAQLGNRIRDLNFDTHIVSNGIIASGAVDLFLAGHNRTRSSNTDIGVHSWVDSDGNEGSVFPPNSSAHDFYINYYLSIGMRSQLANDFYFFTINTADSNSLHFMDESEIQLYEIFTE
jgi:hypothetical protein